ncbi:sensor histidine kinase [Herbiconiux sp. A18JL235]|uniref:histidine kinase n=1 Tax=Herbiconiux sp. A18JL235 TaxID=3152363 RepID=A0AB39BI38_9MICO
MSTAPPTSAGTRSPLSRALALVGVVLIGWAVVFGGRELAPWVPAATGVALAAWVAIAALPARAPAAVRIVALGILVAGGSLAAVPTSMITVVPMIVGLVGLFADTSLPWAVGGVAAVACAAAIAVVSLITAPPLGMLVAGLGLVLLGVLLGVTRRQQAGARLAEQRLVEQRLATQTERARSAALDERARIARDLHDTLAHSLGALVVQLDALEALVEAGKTDDVLARARAARAMAADGLDEARRAVLTLREEPAGKVEAATLEQQVAALVAQERSLGVLIDGAIELEGARLTAASAEAVRRAAQEALTNARKHAPGLPIALDLRHAGGRVVLTVSNAIGATATTPLAASGTGSGLAGMRERAETLPGARFEVSRDAGRFTIRMEVVAS